MQKYIEVTEHQVSDLQVGLEMINKVVEGADMELFIYGLTTSKMALLAASEALEGYDDAEHIEPLAIVVSIALTDTSLSKLLGSGLKLHEEAFVYNGDLGEGGREAAFTFAKHKPLIAISDFSKIAISGTDVWADEFLAKHNASPARVTRNENSVDFHGPSGMDSFLEE